MCWQVLEDVTQVEMEDELVSQVEMEPTEMVLQEDLEHTEEIPTDGMIILAQ